MPLQSYKIECEHETPFCKSSHILKWHISMITNSVTSLCQVSCLITNPLSVPVIIFPVSEIVSEVNWLSSVLYIVCTHFPQSMVQILMLLSLEHDAM